jgi:sterol desaturase/sphingolipid hydroxylase (fatty acid hydroxylase superfamily)
VKRFAKNPKVISFSLSAFWESEVLARVSSPFLLVSLGTFLWHQVYWFVLNLPYLVAEDAGWWERYRVQPGKKHSSSERWALFKVLLWDQHVMLLPLSLLAFPLLSYINISVKTEDLPTGPAFLAMFLVFNVVEDTLFYWSHRALHHPYLYQHVHSKHHSYTAPFALAGEVAHPLEFLFGFLVPIFAGPAAVGLCHGPVHVTVLWAWLLFRELRSVDAHSGLHLPFHPLRLVPFYGGARYHDRHHSLKGRQTNFGGYKVWDWLMGTLAKET